MKILYSTSAFLCLSLGVGFFTTVHAQQNSAGSATESPAVAAPLTTADSALVHVAYGVQPKKQVTGAISTVTGEELRKTTAATLSNTLYGRLPGLTVMQGSGEPGWDQPTLIARGLSSYRGSNILVFVDGFESTFDQLVPDEIETISLLKDAAATALYGIRGANGVLLVTTKRGRTGTPEINFRAQTGWQSPVRLPEFLGSYDYARLYNEALANENKPLRYTATDLEAYRTGSDPYFHPDVNWYQEILKKSTPISNYNLNFRGGNTNARYFVLLNVLQNNGLYKNTDPKREENSNAYFLKYNFRGNVDIDLSKNLSASLDLGARVEDRSTPQGTGASTLFNRLALTPPNAFPVYNPDGTYGGNSIYTNPVATVLSTGVYSNHNRNLQATVRFTEKLNIITEGLSATGALSFSNYFSGISTKSKSFAAFELTRGTEGDTIYRQIGENTSLQGGEGYQDQWRRSNAQLGLNYNRHFGQNEVTAMLLYHQDTYTIGGNNVPFAHQSVGGRLTYSFKEKYIGEVTASYSGSDNFPKGKRFGVFPALSAGWIISEENFLQNTGWLDYLKLRASYGLVGNDQIGGQRFMYDQYFYYSGGYNFGNNNNWAGGISEGNLANPGVTWEKSRRANVGLEARLLKGWEVTVDIFNEKRYDILAEPFGTVPSFLGVALPALNEGEVRNRGFESIVGYTSTPENAFQYFVKGSAWFARNKILYMSEPVQPYEYLYQTGRSIGQPFGLQADGFYQEADFDANGSLKAGLPVPQFGPVQPGDIKYKNQNNDNFIDIYDYKAIGKPALPEWTFGFQTGFKYKGIDFEAFFQGVTNRTVYLNGTEVWAFQNNAGVTPLALGRWTPQTAAAATYPRLSTTINENNYRLSDFWQRDGSFLRLRTLEAGYSLPATLVNKLKLNNARVYINGVNLFTWDKVDITDPETLTGYPALKSWNIGVSVQL